MKDFRFAQCLIANVDAVLVDIGYIVCIQKMFIVFMVKAK